MEDQERIEYENALTQAGLQSEGERIRNIQQDVMLKQQDTSMIKEQLDLGEELDRIDYLLRGYTMQKDKETGEMDWVAPTDKDMIILSDYGVHLIRNTIAWYINKNTLLSNYDEDTIRSKMEDFASDLNDTVFMEYEKVFEYPTFEECKGLLNDRLENKKNMRIFALEIMGKEVGDLEVKEIKNNILKQMEPIIEKELDKIKQQVIKNKLKRFMIIIREIQDAVHSTYNRAWNGQERKTLREHIHISETKGNTMPMAQPKTGLLNYFRKR